MVSYGVTQSSDAEFYNTACKGVLFISLYFCQTKENVRIEEAKKRHYVMGNLR